MTIVTVYKLSGKKYKYEYPKEYFRLKTIEMRQRDKLEKIKRLRNSI